MIILLSPAKTMKPQNIASCGAILPSLVSHSEEILQVLQNMSRECL